MTAGATLTTPDLDWLLELLAVPSVSPLEGGELAALGEACEVFVAGARHRGFRLREHVTPWPEELRDPVVPEVVRARLDEPGFLAAHRSAVLSIGAEQPVQRRLVVNFHLDTVAPHIAPVREDGVVRGRGALDDKGPGVAAAVGVAAAFAREPWLEDEIEVRLAAVPGEEGGALGVLGTRCVVDRGHVGRLMVFAEPTDLAVHDAATATATARFEVSGDDATDDHPDLGHNATLALALIARRLADDVVPVAEALGAKACLAGAHTGHSHNRVYGSGGLLLNLAYRSAQDGATLLDTVHRAFAAAGAEARARYAGSPTFARLADDWSRVVALRWVKRDVPPLANRDGEMEALCTRAGLPRIDAAGLGRAFTCDAIWAAGPGRYVAVCGPGDLAEGGAHTASEHIELAALDAYATGVRDLVVAFGRHQRALRPCR